MTKLISGDYTKNIRKNYLTIDSGDGKVKDLLYDVKTETIPSPYFEKVINRTIKDDEKYGRRLINEEQVPLLPKYDIVIFGAFKRGDSSEWYPIGYQSTEYLLKNYKVTKKRPDGGYYPFAALPVRTSCLLDIKKLL